MVPEVKGPTIGTTVSYLLLGSFSDRFPLRGPPPAPSVLTTPKINDMDKTGVKESRRV